jgi:plasmid maintenance system antidote protein VapI
MYNPPLHPPLNSVDPFAELFLEAEKSDTFWVSKAKLHFTEDMLAQMDALGINKTELASRLGVKPAQISRLCGGLNNFTLETMVRVARALNCEFRCHLQPEGANTLWIDVLKENPAPSPCWTRQAERYPQVKAEQRVAQGTSPTIITEQTVTYVGLAA